MAALTLHWFALDVPSERRAAWTAWLSPAERARAARLVVPKHGWRYVAAHAHLRWLLAQRLGCRPVEVAFERSAHGKPYLAGRPLHFNLSDSSRLGLIGLCPTQELGVDIEVVRPDRDVLRLARRFFNPAETAWLESQPARERAYAFCRLWTCKEAWMKADGRGLALPLRHAEVSLAATGAELRTPGPPEHHWFVRELKLAPGYAAAVVTAGPHDSLTVTELSIPY